MNAMEALQRLAIVGGGRAAWAFGKAWLTLGRPITGVFLRPESTSQITQHLASPRLSSIEELRGADLILVAVGDDVLNWVARALASALPPEVALFHPSGSRDSSVFDGRRRAFSLHPLMALPAVGEPVSFRDRLLVAEGGNEGRELASWICSEMGARLTLIESAAKPAYHAAAVMASNYVAALLETSRQLLVETGVDGVQRSDLAALARSAADNWATHEGAAAFTGPIARGDAALIATHLEALEGTAAREAYRLLGSILATYIGELKDDERLERIARLLKP